MLLASLICSVLSAAPIVAGDGSKGGKVIVLVNDRAQLEAVAHGTGVELLARFRVLDGFVADVTAAGWKRLSTDPRVRSVELSRALRPQNEEAATLTRAREVERQLGFSGRGVRIAVLDTGVDRGHPDLDGGIIGEKCFVSPNGCPPGNSDVGASAPDISTGHGTHVSGTITGDGVVAPRGVAAGSEVLMVRVFDATAYGNEADWAIALDWVLAERATYGIRLVNLSLGTDLAYAGSCDAQWPAMGDALGRLRDAGVAAFASTGNGAIDGGITAPACLAAAIAVGGVYDADLAREPDTGTYSSGCVDQNATAGSVICFSNSSARVDLLAPGSRIRSSAPGGGVSEKRGTSQAAAHATAVAALLLEADPLLTPDALQSILKSSGVPTLDPKTQVTTPRIDALAAVTLALQTQCMRRTAGASCALSADAGGVCSGATCVAASAADAGALARIDGTLPAAGCSSVSLLAPLLASLLLFRRRARWVVASLSVVACQKAAEAPPPRVVGWQVYTGERGVKLELPGRPRDDSVPRDGVMPDGSRLPQGMRNTTVWFGPSSCGMSVLETGGVPEGDRAAMLEAGMRVRRQDGRVLKEEPLTLAGADGRELEVERADGERRWTRLYLTDTRIFVVMCTVPRSQVTADEPIVRRTLNSFALTPE
jgi:hypothetical protein